MEPVWNSRGTVVLARSAGPGGSGGGRSPPKYIGAKRLNLGAKWRAGGGRGGGGGGGADPPKFRKTLGRVSDFLLAGLGHLRSWQVLVYLGSKFGRVSIFVGRFRSSEKVGRF